ncbi:MAG TPA: endolytic transglycosylase MltG [Streptosporangiaceae bacterium]|nr:endolytic transglycosylase MltG [Streptosporangiaceae bacterium]
MSPDRRARDGRFGEPPWPAAEPAPGDAWPAGDAAALRQWPSERGGYREDQHGPADDRYGPRDTGGRRPPPPPGETRGRHSGPQGPPPNRGDRYQVPPQRYDDPPDESGGESRGESRRPGRPVRPASRPDPRLPVDDPGRIRPGPGRGGPGGSGGSGGHPAGARGYPGEPGPSQRPPRPRQSAPPGVRYGPPPDDRYPPGDRYDPSDDEYGPPPGDRRGPRLSPPLPPGGARARRPGPGEGYPEPPDRQQRSRDPRGRSGPPPADRQEELLDDWYRGSGRDDDGGRTGGRPPRRRRRRSGVAALIAAVVILVPLIVGGVYVYRVIAGHFFPADYSGSGTGQVIVEVYPGDTATAVGDRLASMGVVASARAFINAAESSKSSSGLEPGFYRLHKHMNALLAFNLLLKPSSRVQLTVTIPEGWRVTQIIPTLARGSHLSLSGYQRAIRDTAALGLPPYAHGNPEGYLFPATYTIQPNLTATTVLQMMVKRFDQEASSVNLAQAAAQMHHTPAQIITVASLAQAEGGKVSDFPKIARVIYNRLAAGMPLQLDSTVFYALHSYGILASNQQLQTSSRYNTYKYPGLPPGPIDSPGDAAIHAALHPAPGPWLYFVTVNPKTRQTVFTASAAVFAQLRAELARNIGNG